MLPRVYLARHGETAWTLSGQHTGRTDIPLTARGEADARRLGERLKSLSFAVILTSPLQRAKRTCELAGFGDRCQVDSDCPSGLTCQKSPPAICVKPNMMGADANVAIDTPQAGDAPTDSKPADAGGLD